MVKFLTRVELHGASGAQYDQLHKAMLANKFTKTIVDDTGREFLLPTAEYFSYGNLTAEQVRELARAAAATTGVKYWVLTMEYASAAWYLDPV